MAWHDAKHRCEMTEDIPVTPYRRDFDTARDPLSARVALGINQFVSSVNGQDGDITITPGGTGATADYKFDTATSAPPASGTIRLNNATPSSATMLWIHNITNGGTDIRRYLEQIAVGSKLVIQDRDNSANYADYQVAGALTDNTTYWAIPVTYLASGGTLANNARLLFAVVTGGSTQPTQQKFTSGSGTYTTPAGCRRIEIMLVGGGAGGDGGGVTQGTASTAGGSSCWNTSGAACTSPVYSAGGGSAGSWTTGNGGAGGTVTGSGTPLDSVAGGAGSPSSFVGDGSSPATGGLGGISSRGGAGAGQYGSTGRAAAANSGSGGGGGAGNTTAGTAGGPGGGAGATVWAAIDSPAATYTYAVGAGGSGGGAGSSGSAGGAGAAGIIIVKEYY